MKRRALVIFSGGQDSTTCLGYALDKYEEVHAIVFDYGQKHRVELDQAQIIADILNVPYTIVRLPFFGDLVVSALTSNGDVNRVHPDNPKLPASFVPNRNAMFLTLAHAYAQRIRAEVLVGGMCETDFSGYPDCRNNFLINFVCALNEGAETMIAIDTPLMRLDKAQTWALAAKVGVLEIVRKYSHTCYNGSREDHPWGGGCGECPACKLRAKGWEDYQCGRWEAI